jgi:hypothetical protein
VRHGDQHVRFLPVHLRQFAAVQLSAAQLSESVSTALPSGAGIVVTGWWGEGGENGGAAVRRWTDRQSLRSAVRDTTTTVLIVAEALHDSAPADIRRLVATMSDELRAAWCATTDAATLSRSAPRFEF